MGSNKVQNCRRSAQQSPRRRCGAGVALTISLCLGAASLVNAQSLVGGRNVNITDSKDESGYIKALGQKAVIEFQPMQPGDVPATYAEADRLRDWVGFAPATPLAQGLGAFYRWYAEWSAGRAAG